jgi:hypothetical protein
LKKADRLFHAIRDTLRPIEGKLFHHPFLKKVEQKKYSERQMAVLPKEEYSIVSSDLLSARYLMDRFGTGPSGPFFRNLVENEEFARDNIVMLAEALGSSRAELEAHEPDPFCQAYPSYFARLALHGSEAEVLVALSSNFSAWWSACKRIAVALEDRYGIPKDATAFLNPLNEVPPPDAPFDDLTQNALERGLAEAVTGKEIIRVARTIQSYELLFWDSLERIAEAA